MNGIVFHSLDDLIVATPMRIQELIAEIMVVAHLLQSKQFCRMRRLRNPNYVVLLLLGLSCSIQTLQEKQIQFDASDMRL